MIRAVFCLAIALSTLDGLCAQAGPRRPNVLWIVADDHAAYVTGAYGNRQVRTPNLDRLAASGMRFDRAFCNSPMCTPSRQSFLTGRYPRTIGVSLLSTPLPESETTLAELLAEQGYETAAIGKMHFNSNLRHGFELRIDLGDYQRARRENPPPRLPEGVEVLPPWRPFKDPARIWLNSRCLPFGAREAEMAGTFLAERAAEFLARPRQRPFFLMVSFYEPHSPFHFPIEYRGRYQPEQFQVPKPGPEDDWQIPAIFRDLTEAERRGIIAAYYTSTEFMDRNVGLVLDALARSGHADNTVVIYLGDNGYSLGQHGRFEKHCCYHPAVRQPLLIRYPAAVRPGSSSSALVEFVDIVPTVLDLCGVPKPQNLQGRSLVDVLAGRTNRHREHVFVEYGHNEEGMVFDGRWKLIYERGKRRRDDGYDPGLPLRGPTIRLFDLQTDPEELVNLAGKPENSQRVESLLRLLADHFRRTDRQPHLIPRSDDPLVVLDHCVQPREAVPPRKKPTKKPSAKAGA